MSLLSFLIWVVRFGSTAVEFHATVAGVIHENRPGCTFALLECTTTDDLGHFSDAAELKCVAYGPVRCRLPIGHPLRKPRECLLSSVSGTVCCISKRCMSSTREIQLHRYEVSSRQEQSKAFHQKSAVRSDDVPALISSGWAGRIAVLDGQKVASSRGKQESSRVQTQGVCVEFTSARALFWPASEC